MVILNLFHYIQHMYFIELLKQQRYNKHILYYIIYQYIGWLYTKVGNFCDDYQVIYRDMDKSTLDKDELLYFDKLETCTGLYSEFESDRKIYPYFKSSEDVDKLIKSIAINLNIFLSEQTS